jgi:hypothetical protein
MNRFILKKNDFLRTDINSFYNTDYLGYGNECNPDYLNVLKNTYGNYSVKSLSNAVRQLENVLKDILDIAYTHSEFNFDWPLTICIVPRAKTNYKKNQLLFHSTIKEFVKRIVDDLNDAQYHEILEDGCDYLTRIKNTKTTHLPLETANYINDGEKPYVGITMATCKISTKVKGKSILLIDDIYTKNINIDEDAIQALLDSGAKSVLFYAVAKTLKK